jgi:hypothetical protein
MNAHPQHGSEPVSHDPHQILLDRYDFQKSITEDTFRWQFRISRWLTLAIPILAAIVTFLSGLGDALAYPNLVLPIAGLLLTVLTIMNSTWKPSERSVRLSEALIALADWQFDLEVEMKMRKPGEKETYEYLVKKNTLLSEIGRKMVETGKTEK